MEGNYIIKNDATVNSLALAYTELEYIKKELLERWDEVEPFFAEDKGDIDE